MSQPTKKKWFLLIENPSKSNHLGTLLRCAAAFNCHQVLLVGYDKFNCRGSFGSHVFLDIVAFHCWDAVLEYLRSGDCLSGDDCGVLNGKVDGSIDESICNSICNEIRTEDKVTIIGVLGAFGGGDEIFSPQGVDVYEQPTGFVSLTPPENEVDEMCSKCSDEHLKSNSIGPSSDTEQILQRTPETQSTSKSLPNKSFPIHTRSFSTHTCFIISKNRNGLPISQARLCHGFVHVPHLDIFDCNTTPLPMVQNASPSSTETSLQSQSITDHSAPLKSPLLDTATTLSIILNHYTAWAGYDERQFAENQKFVKDDRPRVRYLGVGKSHEKKENIVEEDGDDDDGEETNLAFWNSGGSSDY